tara:strand:+ start:1354 stop:1554 length:201 start_codon:yes stop_codon:yes gene_type:complete
MTDKKERTVQDVFDDECTNTIKTKPLKNNNNTHENRTNYPYTFNTKRKEMPYTTSDGRRGFMKIIY